MYAWVGEKGRVYLLFERESKKRDSRVEHDEKENKMDLSVYADAFLAYVCEGYAARFLGIGERDARTTKCLQASG